MMKTASITFLNVRSMQQLPLFGLIYALPCHDGLPYKRYVKLGSIQPQHSLYEVTVSRNLPGVDMRAGFARSKIQISTDATKLDLPPCTRTFSLL